MLEQAEPDEYTPDDVPRNNNGKKVWRTDELPIIPETWVLKPKDSAKKQLAAIGKLIKEASEIVNAGDPDREGQLLVDDVLLHFKSTKPTQRFWVSSQDMVTVKRGLTSYPRTDCAYLPEAQHADAPNVLAAIKHVNPELASLVDGADAIHSGRWH